MDVYLQHELYKFAKHHSSSTVITELLKKKTFQYGIPYMFY